MRKIDSKFHVDGDKIIKTTNGQEVPLDEPLFLIRGRDYLALPLLRIFKELSMVDGCTQYHMAGLQNVIEDFLHFKIDNPDKMKQPGITLGK